MRRFRLSPTLRQSVRQLVGVAVVAAVTLFGGLWYWMFEGFGFVDALYQSFITVSTVGFGEIAPLDTSGRIFTIVLIVVGVTSMVYALGGFAELLIESSIRRFRYRRRERTLEKMSNHTVVCGYGRTGAAVARLLPEVRDLGIIERDPEKVDNATLDGYVVIEGDSTLDETLRSAGLERADRLIVCLESDSDAISTVLSARVLNPDILIISRVNDTEAASKLRLAGADHVVSPIEMGAQRMVADAREPSMGPFLDAALHDESVGLSLRTVSMAQEGDAQSVHAIEAATGVRILGVQDHSGDILQPRDLDDVVHPGQTVLASGHHEELAELKRYMSRLV